MGLLEEKLWYPTQLIMVFILPGRENLIAVQKEKARPQMLYFQTKGTTWKIAYKGVLVNFCVLS